jgi:dTDP-4-dehydrorhamnose 3,5-epimerase-like enzyme
MSRLDEITFIPRRLLKDPRGWFLKVIDGKEPSLPPRTGEIYLTSAEPGQARGNHFHRHTAEWFTVVRGRARLIAQDPATGERRTWTLNAETPQTVFVPAGVGHVFVNPEDAAEAFILLAYADALYDPNDTIPLNIF